MTKIQWMERWVTQLSNKIPKLNQNLYQIVVLSHPKFSSISVLLCNLFFSISEFQWFPLNWISEPVLRPNAHEHRTDFVRLYFTVDVIVSWNFDFVRIWFFFYSNDINLKTSDWSLLIRWFKFWVNFSFHWVFEWILRE